MIRKILCVISIFLNQLRLVLCVGALFAYTRTSCPGWFCSVVRAEGRGFGQGHILQLQVLQPRRQSVHVSLSCPCFSPPAPPPPHLSLSLEINGKKYPWVTIKKKRKIPRFQELCARKRDKDQLYISYKS